MSIAVLLMIIIGSLKSPAFCSDTGRKEPSRNLYTFLTLLSGYFDNYEQISRDRRSGGSDRHLAIQNLFKVVHVRSLADKYTVYTEEIVNKTPTYNFLWVFSEDNYGVIHGQAVNIVSIRNHKPLDKGDVDYSDIILGPLPRPGVCEDLFYELDSNVYVGSSPICVNNTNQEIAHYSSALTCNSLSIDPSSPVLPEKIGTLPNSYRKRFSFPLLPSMVNLRQARYKSRCIYN